MDARRAARPQRPPAGRSPPGATVRIVVEKTHGREIEQPSAIICRHGRCNVATADELIKFL